MSAYEKLKDILKTVTIERNNARLSVKALSGAVLAYENENLKLKAELETAKERIILLETKINESQTKASSHRS